MEIKTKVNKWDLIKLKSFCTGKETISKVKRQFSEWEKITGNETTDKGLLLLLLLSHFSRVRLCNPIDGSPPGSPVPGFLQARTLEWVAISFSNT